MLVLTRTCDMITPLSLGHNLGSALELVSRDWLVRISDEPAHVERKSCRPHMILMKMVVFPLFGNKVQRQVWIISRFKLIVLFFSSIFPSLYLYPTF